MMIVFESFGLFLPYAFVICVCRIIFDMAVMAFVRGEF